MLLYVCSDDEEYYILIYTLHINELMELQFCQTLIELLGKSHSDVICISHSFDPGNKQNKLSFSYLWHAIFLFHRIFLD